MSALQAILLAILQGVTELFPVSSLGHGVVLPRLLGWTIDQSSPQFLPFLVLLHVGTAAALLLYFWRDWLGFLQALLGKGPDAVGERKTFVLLVFATLPAVVIGFAFEHLLRDSFAKPVLAAAFLLVNGVILFIGERIKHRGAKAIADIGILPAFLIGACQALALIPGISRSGATMVGGVMAGLRHRDAARFSFLMATPIIAGAGVFEVPKLLHRWNEVHIGPIALAGLVAGVTAFLSTAFLMRYFRKHEVEALDPFAWYCWALGSLALVLLA